MTISIDGPRELSDSWTGFTQFTPLDEKPPDRYMWSGEETDKTANETQTRSFMARTLDEIGKKCKAEERSINGRMNNRNSITPEDYEEFIDPEDKEFRETIRNARKKLETPMAPAMPCKTCKKSQNGENSKQDQ